MGTNAERGGARAGFTPGEWYPSEPPIDAFDEGWFVMAPKPFGANSRPLTGRSPMSRDCSRCMGSGREIDPVAFGAVVRRNRLKRGLGLREVARLSGASPTAVSQLERGKMRGWGSEMGRQILSVVGVEMKQEIAVSAIWLRGEGHDAVVLVEVDGAWVEVIREGVYHPDGVWPASHIVEGRGIRAALERTGSPEGAREGEGR